MGDGDAVFKRAHTNLGDYEEDVIAEILARLPVKSLKRFRCVCKSWRALISGSYFVKKHLSYVERGVTGSAHRLIFLMDPPLALDCEALISMEEEFESLDCQALRNMDYYEASKSTEHFEAVRSTEDYEALERIKKYVDGGQFAVTLLDFPVRKTIYDYGWRDVVGACNGLLCVKYPCDGDSKAIMLWNPCTRDYKVLPNPPQLIESKDSCYCLNGFGYDPATDNYKVILGFTYDENGAKKIIIHIFALKTGSWRTVQDIDYVALSTRLGLYVNGALHWLYSPPEGGSRILSFDLGAEEFQKTIPLPYDDWFSDPLIHKNCLCVCTCPTGSNSINIWMMKEYGAKESWTEVLQFSQENSILTPLDFRQYFSPVCILENGVVLISKMGTFDRLVVFSNLKEKTYEHFVEVAGDTGFETVSYWETLVSPDALTYKTNNVSW